MGCVEFAQQGGQQYLHALLAGMNDDVGRFSI